MNDRTRIKICGITNMEDARASIEYGADAIGFVFVPESPRYVGSDSKLLMKLPTLPPFVMKVALCTSENATLTDFIDTFDIFQLYSTEFKLPRGKTRFQAFRMKGEESLEEIDTALKLNAAASDPAPLSAIFLDAYHKDKLGGSGEVFNWELAVEAKRRFDIPMILAGGLTPENVGEAVKRVRPYAVDISSGVEAEPGRKDHAKLKAFIYAVRNADAESRRS